jgi:hypothetical protein
MSGSTSIYSPVGTFAVPVLVRTPATLLVAGFPFAPLVGKEYADVS